MLGLIIAKWKNQGLFYSLSMGLIFTPRLSVACMSRKDLPGHSLSTLQDKMSNIGYLLADEYSILGQSLGWVDKHCRLVTGKKDQVFGGKSIFFAW